VLSRATPQLRWPGLSRQRVARRDRGMVRQDWARRAVPGATSANPQGPSRRAAGMGEVPAVSSPAAGLPREHRAATRGSADVSEPRWRTLMSGDAYLFSPIRVCRWRRPPGLVCATWSLATVGRTLRHRSEVLGAVFLAATAKEVMTGMTEMAPGRVRDGLRPPRHRRSRQCPSPNPSATRYW
jgi:hypothetical protein